MSASLSPRARALLVAVEREAETRRHALTEEPPPVHAEPALLAALELGVAGLPRDAVAERLRADYGLSDPGPVLDAVFAGSARLQRAPTPRTAPR